MFIDTHIYYHSFLPDYSTFSPALSRICILISTGSSAGSSFFLEDRDTISVYEGLFIWPWEDNLYFLRYSFSESLKVLAERDLS